MNRSQTGVGLIEALISLLLFSVGILGMVGLQAALLQDSSDTRVRIQAGFLATSLLGMAAADAAELGCFIVNSPMTSPCTSEDAQAHAEQWTNDVLRELPGTDTLPPTVAYDSATGQMSVTLRWQSRGDDMVHNYVAVSQVSTGL
jgi:type IV pilus assembly protein PilV